jgi:hypothetical protein
VAISLVQHASGAIADNTVTITLAATGSGNALIIVATVDSTGDSDLQSVTLGGSAAGWASQFYAVGTDVEDISVWANFAVAGGQTSLVVTVPTANGVKALAVDAYEVSGGLSALDKSVHQEVDGTSGSWSSTATATTGYAAEFILGVVTGYNNAGANFTFTGPSAPWVNETQLALVTGFASLSGYQIASSTGTFTYSGTANTTGSNLYYGAAVVTFRTSPSTTGPAFQPGNSAVQARRQRLPLQGRVRSSPGGPPSTHTISSSGGISLQPFGFLGYSLASYGLLVTAQAEQLLNAILVQAPAAASGPLSLRLGSGTPTAVTAMAELLGGTGYTTGGQVCAFTAAAAGISTNSTALSWTNSGVAWEITGLEFWDPGPVRWIFADWSGAPIAVATGNSFAIPAGSLVVKLQ